MKTSCKLLLILIVFTSGMLFAQNQEKSPRELGLYIQRFNDLGFIYKGGARVDKKRHLRISINLLRINWSPVYTDFPPSRTKYYESYASLNLNAGTEKRKQIFDKLQFIRGLQSNFLFSYNQDKFFYNYWQTEPIVKTRYQLGLGLNYLLGFRYELNSKIAFTIEGQPGFIYYAISEPGLSNNNPIIMYSGSVNCSVTCLLNRRIKKNKSE